MSPTRKTPVQPQDYIPMPPSPGQTTHQTPSCLQMAPAIPTPRELGGNRSRLSQDPGPQLITQISGLGFSILGKVVWPELWGLQLKTRWLAQANRQRDSILDRSLVVSPLVRRSPQKDWGWFEKTLTYPHSQASQNCFGPSISSRIQSKLSPLPVESPWQWLDSHGKIHFLRHSSTQLTPSRMRPTAACLLKNDLATIVAAP